MDLLVQFANSGVGVTAADEEKVRGEPFHLRVVGIRDVVALFHVMDLTFFAEGGFEVVAGAAGDVEAVEAAFGVTIIGDAVAEGHFDGVIGTRVEIGEVGEAESGDGSGEAESQSGGEGNAGMHLALSEVGELVR